MLFLELAQEFLPKLLLAGLLDLLHQFGFQFLFELQLLDFAFAFQFILGLPGRAGLFFQFLPHLFPELLFQIGFDFFR